MKQGDEITINNKVFVFQDYYNRLQAKDDNKPAIACPKCYNTKFEISYGN